MSLFPKHHPVVEIFSQTLWLIFAPSVPRWWLFLSGREYLGRAWVSGNPAEPFFHLLLCYAFVFFVDHAEAFPPGNAVFGKIIILLYFLLNLLG